MMTRLLVVAIMLGCSATQGWTLASSAPSAAATETIKPTIKPAVRKPAVRSEPADRAPCGVGVVISTGNEFTVMSTGLTVFQNKATKVPVPGWGLKDLIFVRIRAAIPAGVSVLNIPYIPPKPLSHDAPKDTFMDRLLRDERAELVARMREITKGTSCRHYIQIGNSISRFGTYSYTVRGFGIINHNLVLGHRIYLYALPFIRVFDGRDFSILRQGSALTNLHPLVMQRLLGAQISGPYRELPEASFPTRPEDAAGNPALRDGVRAMLTESLDKTLPLLLGSRPAARQSDAKQR